MSNAPDLDIRGQLPGLRLGTRSLSEFCRWFGETIDRAESEVDEASWALFLDVENVLAELSGDHLSSEQARDALRHMGVDSILGAPVPVR